MNISVITTKGKETGSYDLPDFMFDVAMNQDLVHQAYRYLVLNRLYPVSHTKDKSEVRGGGRKPWKQKGTGRARHGSTRSPIWRSGGVTFGPTKDRSFGVAINKKMRRKALYMLLSDFVAKKSLILVDTLELSEMKTKKALNLLQELELSQAKTLVVIPQKDLVVEKSLANIKTVKVIHADSLNVEDLLKYDKLLLSIPAVEVMAEVYKG